MSKVVIGDVVQNSTICPFDPIFYPSIFLPQNHTTHLFLSIIYTEKETFIISCF